MAEPATKLKKAIRLVKKRGSIRPRDLVALDIPGDYLDRLRRRGVIERVARGVYAWPDAEVTEHHSLSEVARSVPAGVICLISALQFHGLTTQVAHEVWVALPNKAWVPKVQSPKLRVVRFSGPALSEMVGEYELEKVTVRIYTPAKTVADCFKFRNTVGLDVAIEALRDCWRKKKATMDELWAAAKVCRMANVMRPYIESLV
ncbi:MAG: transcriptional regulator-like protein [Gemmataceae bacterium]|nr:transcriptional regulator-like protein [Gemmataceae bacterium]